MRTPYGNKRVSVRDCRDKLIGVGYVVMTPEDRELRSIYCGLSFRGPGIRGTVPIYNNDKVTVID